MTVTLTETERTILDALLRREVGHLEVRHALHLQADTLAIQLLLTLRLKIMFADPNS